LDKSKKIFLILAAIFLLILLYIGYDFAQKTAFPGSNSGQKTDSLKQDTSKVVE